jgi:glycosyltransferase involved in cell wall biosynthesis
MEIAGHSILLITIMPTVSIIIPTYNREHLLGRAIQSVLDQTYQNFELIIVDDGSTDDTERLVKSFNSEKIRYIRHGENKGPSAARNTGIQSAKGDYIAFQDSDDEWMPRKLEKQMRTFETAQPEVGIVYTDFIFITTNKRKFMPAAGVSPKDGDIFSNLLKGNFVSLQATVVKRECFERAGIFDERFPPLADWELLLRMSRHYQFKCINEPLVIMYRQPDSISENKRAYIRAHKLILEAYFQDIKQVKTVLAWHYFKLGHLLCSYGELSQGRSYFIRSLKAHLLNIKALGGFLASLLGKNVYHIVAGH